MFLRVKVKPEIWSTFVVACSTAATIAFDAKKQLPQIWQRQIAIEQLKNENENGKEKQKSVGRKILFRVLSHFMRLTRTTKAQALTAQGKREKGKCQRGNAKKKKEQEKRTTASRS